MAVGETVKALGLGTALSYFAARSAVRFPAIDYHRYRIVAVPRAGMPTMPHGFEVRQIKADELKTFVIDAPQAVQAERFASGLSCLGAFAGSELVGVNWLTQSSYDEDEAYVRYRVPDDAAWDTGLWIRPDRRLSRAFAALWAGTAAWLDERGLARSLSRIADYNLTSLNSHRRMGGQALGTIMALRIGGFQVATKVRPRVTRIGRDAPAVVDLRPWR